MGWIPARISAFLDSYSDSVARPSSSISLSCANFCAGSSEGNGTCGWAPGAGPDPELVLRPRRRTTTRRISPPISTNGNPQIKPNRLAMNPPPISKVDWFVEIWPRTCAPSAYWTLPDVPLMSPWTIASGPSETLPERLFSTTLAESLVNVHPEMYSSVLLRENLCTTRGVNNSKCGIPEVRDL